MYARGVADAAELFEVMGQSAIDGNGALEAAELLGEKLMGLAHLGGVAAGAQCIADSAAGGRHVAGGRCEQSLRRARDNRVNGGSIDVGEFGHPCNGHRIGMRRNERRHSPLEWPQRRDELA